MTEAVHERPLTRDERAILENFLARYPSRTRRAAENALVAWAALMLCFVVAWAITAWATRPLLHLDFGWKSPATIWLAPAGAVVCAAFAWRSTWRWMTAWKDSRPLAQKDLADGLALEERFRFTEAKRFQEQEHGGLIYFLRSSDNRVFVIYDNESQDLGVSGEDPLASPFRPLTHLLLARAPATRFVLTKSFSGEPLQLEETAEILIPADQWPEADEFCEIPWEQLEQRLACLT